MGQLPQLPTAQQVFNDSFLVSSGELVRVGRGVLRYDGERPGPGWDAHGWFDKTITVLVDGAPKQVVLLKR